MCLAMPARIAQIGPDDQAIVDLDGVKKAISLALTPEVALGDYVIVHAGFALQKLDLDEAERSLALFAKLASSS